MADAVTEQQMEGGSDTGGGTPGTVVRSLLIPMHGFKLLLPNTAVAEVAAFSEPATTSGTPDWLLGMFSWRGLTIPLVSFERLLGRESAEQEPHAKVVVANTLNRDPAMPFIGLLAQGVPRSSLVTEGMLERTVVGQGEETAVLCHATVRGEAVVIPDLDALEGMLIQLGIKVR